MKLAFFLLCAFGAASAKFLIKPGQEHVYAYSGRILTGIPELENVFSGLAIDCKVLLQAGQGRPGTNTFKVALRDVQFSNFNQKLNGPLPLNWRTMVTPATAPVINAHKIFLESPVEVEMVNWEIKKVIISAEEPEWSVNFKKALIAAIKVKLPLGNEHENRISREGVPAGAILAVPQFWTVMEQGVDGVCENTYQVTEIPEYLVSAVERNLMKRELCEGKKVFQVVRTRDITKCTARSLFIASRQHENCLMGNCNGAVGKSSSTRFLGCGENKEALQLHAIINEGEHQQNLLAFNTEKVVTGTKQVLALQAVNPAASQLPAIKDPRIVEDLLYEYPKVATVEQKKQITNYRKQQEFFRDQAQNPRDQVFRADGKPRAMDQAMKQKIVQKFVQVAADLDEVEHFGKKQVTSVLHALKTIISVRTVDELKAVYNEVKTKDVVRKLFLDTVMISGTNPAVIFCKEMIIAKELTLLEATDFIVTLPHNIKAPSAKILEELFQLITHPVVTAHKAVKANAYIAFATIVNRACFHQYEITNAVFPEDVLGKMCRAHKDHIVSQFIAHLEKELQAANEQEAQVVIMALGALGHQSAVSKLIPYIEGRAPNALAQNIDIRQMAIYSLSQVAYQHRNTLLPVFAALVHNPNEHRDIRIAAFSIMLSMDPSTVHLQKIAVATWFEEDQHVAKYIYSSLRSLAHMKRSQIPNDSKVFGLTIKAATVLPLAKPVPGIISSNFNSFFADILKELQVAYQGHAAMTVAPNSHAIYFKLNMFLKQARYIPLEFAAQVRGVKTVIVEALRVVAADSNVKVHRELEKIIEKLEIAPKADAPIEAGIWARLHNDVQLFIQTPQVNAEYIKEKLKAILKVDMDQEIKRKICGKTPIQIHRVFELLPYVAVVPSDMGFPIMIETQSTNLVAMKGELDVACAAQTLPAINLHAAVKSAHSWSGYAGTVSPFMEQRKELLAAGIDTHHAVNFPVHAMIKVEPATGTVLVEMKQVKQVTPQTNNVDLVHIHVLPFTTRKPVVFEDVTPAILDRVNTKILQAVRPRKQFEMKMGQSLGLDLKYVQETESDLADRKMLLDAVRNFRYNPVLALAMEGAITALKADGTPSIRYHKAILVHNPQASNTKAMKVAIKVAAAKMEEREIVEYIAEKSDKRIQHKEKLTQSIQKLRSLKAVAAHALVEVALIGGAPKTYVYSLTAAKGSTEQEHKWNLHLESEAMPGMVCVTGSLELPVNMASQLKLKYNNRIGFGANCDEYFVNVDGFTATTQRQEEASRRSEATRKCAKLSREVTELHERIQTQPQGEKKAIMEQEHAELSYRKIAFCEEQRKLETSLDKVELDITTSPRLPNRVYTIAKFIDSSLKGLLFQYMAGLPAVPQISGPVAKVILDFNQRLNTVTMRITSPLDSTLFKNIRLPHWARNLLPMSYARSFLDQSYRALYGSSIRSKCVIGQDQVKTFDKKIFSYQMDDCNHLVASDCSPRKNHAVLAKEKDNVKHITIYYKETKIVLREPAARYLDPASNYKVEVDGREVEVMPRQKIAVRPSCFIQWAADANNIVVDTPAHRVQYNGKIAIVEEKALANVGQTCGLCGDNTQDRRGDLKSSKMCVHRSIKSMVQSYRVDDSQCVSRISTTDRNILKQQMSSCSMTNTVKQQRFKQQQQQHITSKKQQGTRQYGGQLRLAGEKEIKHAIVLRAGEICISKEQIPQCGPNSVARDVEQREVEFVCRRARDQEAKVWERMAREGKQIPQLRAQEKSFQSRVEVARDCARDY